MLIEAVEQELNLEKGILEIKNTVYGCAGICFNFFLPSHWGEALRAKTDSELCYSDRLFTNVVS